MDLCFLLVDFVEGVGECFDEICYFVFVVFVSLFALAG